MRDRRRLGLSWKLLALTVLFVMASAILIYVPSIANFRVAWLDDRLTLADAASTVPAEAVANEIPRTTQDDLLKAVGAIAIVVRTGTVSRLLATVDMPPKVDDTVDLRVMDPTGEVADAFRTLLSPSRACCGWSASPNRAL